MKSMSMNALMCFLFICLGFLSLVSCSSTPSSGSVVNEGYLGTCYGQVIDRSTRSGISAATVDLFGGSVPSTSSNVSDSGENSNNFVVQTTTASDDADTTLYNEAGMFRFDDLPLNAATQSYQVRIGATDYATVETTCSLTTASSGVYVVSNIGTIDLTLGVNLTVQLVNIQTGGLVASCPVYAVPVTGTDGSSLNSTVGTDISLSGVEVASTTDASGLATLAGLDPLITYTIVAPACDSDANGTYNFQTATGTFDTSIDTNTTFNLALSPAEVDETPALIATSCGQFSATEDPLMPNCAVSTTGALSFVFNYPIDNLATSGALQLTLNAETNFTAGDTVFGSSSLSIDFDGDNQSTTDVAAVTTATYSLSAGNTILTVTPGSALSQGGFYHLEGTLTASDSGDNGSSGNEDGEIESLDFATLLDAFFDSTIGTTNNEVIYVVPASDTSITDPTLDNYDGARSAGTARTTACLEFGELVIGSVRVESVTSTATGTAVTTPDSTGTVSNLNAGTLVNESVGTGSTLCGGSGVGCPSSSATTCENSEAIKYVVPVTIPTSVVNNAAGASNTVTMYIDAIDFNGNQLQKEITLAVE